MCTHACLKNVCVCVCFVSVKPVWLMLHVDWTLKIWTCVYVCECVLGRGVWPAAGSHTHLNTQSHTQQCFISTSWRTTLVYCVVQLRQRTHTHTHTYTLKHFNCMQDNKNKWLVHAFLGNWTPWPWLCYNIFNIIAIYIYTVMWISLDTHAKVA